MNSQIKRTRRKKIGQIIYPDKESKWEAIADRIVTMNRQNRPVLVGTRSVRDSEHLSRLLHSKDLDHQILNARQDAMEAEIVASAGKLAMVTVATNMAGRGTDIPLADGVADLGGLHIIVAECNEVRRVDRQLYGRCGRQGDPGTYELILSAGDELLEDHISERIRGFLARLIQRKMPLNQQITIALTRFSQRLRERQYYHMRRDLLQLDEQLSKLLAFSGRME